MKLAMDVDGWWMDVDCAHVDVFILVFIQYQKKLMIRATYSPTSQYHPISLQLKFFRSSFMDMLLKVINKEKTLSQAAEVI